MLAISPAALDSITQFLGAVLGAAVLAFLHFLRREQTVVNGHTDKWGRPKREPGLPAIYSKLDDIHTKVTRVDQRLADHIDDHRHKEKLKVMSTKPRKKAARTG